MKKYILIIDQIRTGGAERILLDYYDYLISCGNQVFIFALYKYNYNSPWTNNIDVNYGIIGEESNLLNKIAQQFYLCYKLHKLIRKHNPDVIFSFLEKSNFIATVATPKHIKKVVTVHNLLSIQYEKISSKIVRLFINKAISWMYNKNKKIIAVSTQVRDDLIQNFNVLEKNVYVVNNYVNKKYIEIKSKEDINDYTFDDQKKYIINVGRLSVQKSQYKLIKAIYILINEYHLHDVKVLIIGEGEKEKELKELVNTLLLTEYIDFIPFTTNPYKYMAHSSLLVLPSIYEGFPIVVSEARSLGLPFVGSNKSIPKEMFENIDVYEQCTFKDTFNEEEQILELAILIKNGINNPILRDLIINSTATWEINNNKEAQFNLYSEYINKK